MKESYAKNKKIKDNLFSKRIQKHLKMAFNKQLTLAERIDWAIDHGKTGCAAELGARLGICKNSVYNYLEVLRGLGAEIEFCESRKSFVYVNNQKPRFPTLSGQKKKDWRGGKEFSIFLLAVQ